jgi:hypothetical protein
VEDAEAQAAERPARVVAASASDRLENPRRFTGRNLPKMLTL